MRWHKSLFFIALVDKVVNSGYLIMLIIIYALLCIVRFETELLYHFKDFWLCGYRILADN